MRLTPRYDGPPIITMAGDRPDVLEPLRRQRRRLETTVAGLREDRWAQESRCSGWSVQDVVLHLVDVNRFWLHSIRAGVAGEPTRMMATFDPVATPAQLVRAAGARRPAEVLASFAASNRALLDLVEGLDDAGWDAIAEAPVGHVTVRVLAHHALWDGWVHERDIALPLGLPPTEEADEVLLCLRYVAALAPAFALHLDPARRGTLTVHVIDQHTSILVAVDGSVSVATPAGDRAGGAQLSGRGARLVDMLSTRVPFDAVVAAADRWMFEGLATVFDGHLEIAPQPVTPAPSAR